MQLYHLGAFNPRLRSVWIGLGIVCYHLCQLKNQSLVSSKGGGGQITCKWTLTCHEPQVSNEPVRLRAHQSLSYPVAPPLDWSYVHYSLLIRSPNQDQREIISQCSIMSAKEETVRDSPVYRCLTNNWTAFPAHDFCLKFVWGLSLWTRTEPSEECNISGTRGSQLLASKTLDNSRGR